MRIVPKLATAVLLLGIILSGSALSPNHGFAAAAPTQAMGWTNVTKPVAPPGVGGGMMAYDSAADRFVSFGGSDGDPTNGTWVLNPSRMEWTLMHPAVSPPARVDGALAYDDHAGAFILFGGWQEPADEVYVRLGDTWVYYLANDSWIHPTPAHSPEARSDAAIAYDPQEDILLLYGGFNGSVYLGDTWQYLFTAGDWAPISGGSVPSRRADGRMVFDSQTGAFYLFGGNDYSGPNFTFHHLDDTWKFTPAGMSWQQLFPTHSPGARDYAVFAADTSAGELLSLGGFGDGTVLGELWAFNTSQRDWRNLTAPGGPPPRMAAIGGYSPAQNVFVVFSGGDKVSIKNDTWAYRFPGPLVGTVAVSLSNPNVGDVVQFRGQALGGSGIFRNQVWSFGDGASAAGSETTHRFLTPGVYTVRFQAEDDLGESMNVTTVVTVGNNSLPYLAAAFGLGAAAVVVVVAYRRRRGVHPPPPPP